MLGPSVVLREENKDPSDDGGGDAAPFTDAQIAALGQLINTAANSAVTAQLKRNLPSAVSDGIKGVNFAEILGPEIAKLKAPESTPGGDKKPTDDFTKTLEAMAAKLEAAEQKAVALERARVEVENKRLHDGALTQFRNALQSKLREDLLDVAVSHWANVEGRLKVNDDGSSTLRVKRAQFKGGPEMDEDLPLTEAIPLLLASKEAKPFIPAPGVQQDKSGQAKQPARVPFAAPSGSADQSDFAKAQSAMDQLSRMGIEDLGKLLG